MHVPEPEGTERGHRLLKRQGEKEGETERQRDSQREYQRSEDLILNTGQSLYLVAASSYLCGFIAGLYLGRLGR